MIMDAPSNPPNVEQACAAARRAMVETCEKARAAGRQPDSSAVLASALERLMAEGVTMLGDCVDHLNRLASDRLLVGEAEPPAAEGLRDEELLQIAADAQIYKFQATAGDPVQYEPTEHQLIAYGRTAIAADRARHPQAEQMAEALRRLRRWGWLHGWDGQVVQNVHDWIDAGMTGPLPPLPDYIVARQGEQP